MPNPSTPPLHVVILAAGEGKRMKSALPKVLQPIAGRPMLAHVIDAARELAPAGIHVVFGHGGEQVRAAFAGQPDLQWAEQAHQLGTGHAVQQAMPGIPDDARVLVLYGDVPLITAATLRRLLDAPRPIAVLGAEPVVKCEGYKTAIAVSTVVIFGTLSMFLYPLMYRTGMLDGLTDTGVAVYTGSTLHEVAHVAGAGNAMDPTDTLGIAGTATITKMIRVMMLAPVLVILGFVLAGRRKTAGGHKEKSKITIPWFAFGFIAVIGLNSLLQYLTGAESVRDIPLNGAIEYVDTFMLTMAMTALGTETSIDKFKHAGAKPFVLAGLLYVWLVVGGYFVTKYLVGIL